MKTIFVVTAIQDENLFIHGVSRVFGWFSNLKEAREHVINNKGDIHEDRYCYAVIEEIASGIHPQVLNEYWYEIDFESKEETEEILFKKCDKPKYFENTYNFGIG